MSFNLTIDHETAEEIWKNRFIQGYPVDQNRYITEDEYMERVSHLEDTDIPIDLEEGSRFYTVESMNTPDVVASVWATTSNNLLQDYRPLDVGDHVVGLIDGSMHGALSGDLAAKMELGGNTVIFRWELDGEFNGHSTHFIVETYEAPRGSTQ
ncbi:hypothetical protein PLICRDRAFT_180613 [Plicaturopsis crispa FD-325 SS-3]|uniref:Unplaced genomic scaffold PLICRscaffold_27, whole genome shotgun sequence n=1 Tax=Plicaturopsis crispa FD-325 SS-3 TaxID=944288 RepID=A0A0C9SQ16_PLICR|nr:hypothetical protein PLICRDRAFT_180613 [Plicaturopsis crispa FD-325 SS-3]